MIRSRPASHSLPLFVLAAAVVAVLAFGATRWITDQRAVALPALELRGDTAAAAPGALDVHKVVNARLDTIVAISASFGDSPMNGTGVVVDARGTIVTASHVVKDYDREGLEATTIVVRFHRGDEVAAQLVAVDQLNDLAILKIDPTEVSGLVAAPLGDSDEVLVGSPVLAIGNPLGYDFTATEGIVSSPNGRVLGSRINASSDITHAIQHDAAINTGNSGGPLFNARGEVIGINQQIATRNGGSVGISFAVASNLVRRAIEQQAATGGRYIGYARVGLEGDRTIDLTPQLAKAAGIPVTHGALVQSVDGAAARAGVSIGRSISHLGRVVTLGDVIVEIDGAPVRSADELKRAIGMLHPEQPFPLVVVRAGDRVQLTVDPTARMV
jgi:S1-C subfamily serine protease